MRFACLCAALVVASACAHVRGGEGARLETIYVGEAVFHLRYSAEDCGAADQVKEVLQGALSAAERWGRLSAPISITIHPTHQAFEAAVHRQGHAWLRAWARFDSIDLQSPRTWSCGPASNAAVAQLVAHELTHCVMYQATATERTWSSRVIPLWFREGMASVTAGEDRDAAGREAILRFYQGRASGDGAGTAGDPLSQPEPLYRSRSNLVYQAADRAFHFLLARYGEERVRSIVAAMSRGIEFREAFQQAVGVSVQEFESDFRHSVVREDRSG